MLYIINGKYYMLRNREYVHVNVELANGELNIRPDREDVMEVNDKIKARGVLIDKVISDLKKETSKKSNKYDM